MAHSTVRKEVSFLGTYKDFKLVEHSGRFYAVPTRFRSINPYDRRRLNRHPAENSCLWLRPTLDLNRLRANTVRESVEGAPTFRNWR